VSSDSDSAVKSLSPTVVDKHSGAEVSIGACLEDNEAMPRRV